MELHDRVYEDDPASAHRWSVPYAKSHDSISNRDAPNCRYHHLLPSVQALKNGDGSRMMTSPFAQVERHKAAIHRTTFGRPLRLALEAQVVEVGASVADYGCGYGDDVGRLRELGYQANGWDPYHAPETQLEASDLCYLGFVLNVIEIPNERVEVLRRAWALARQVLVVGALVTVDARGVGNTLPFGDGVVTRIGTFQKYFDQKELENLLRSTLEAEPVALGMGAFAVFRDPEAASRLLTKRLSRTIIAPSGEQFAALLSARRETLRPLVDFFLQRGRWPIKEERIPFQEVLKGLGRLERVVAALETDGQTLGIDFAGRKQQVREDLELTCALGRVRAVGKDPHLHSELRHELVCHYGTLRKAFNAGDQLLLSLGDMKHLRRLAAGASIGKRMPEAIYLHQSAVSALPVALRLYLEVGRIFVGEVEGVNIYKLHLDRPAISFLSYPDFDTIAHPELKHSLHVDLQTFRMKFQVYENNPPILHRKEQFVGEDYPQHARFGRLTKQEENWDLFDGSTGSIGNRDQWENRLRVAGVRIVGHRLFRAEP